MTDINLQNADGHNKKKTEKSEDEIRFEKLLKSFAENNNVYGTLYDRDGEVTASFFDSDSHRDFFRQRISDDMVMVLISSFRDYDAENVLSGRTSMPLLLLKAVAMRGADERVSAVFVMYGLDSAEVHEFDVIPEDIRRTTEQQFESSAAFLEQLGKSYYFEKLRSEELSELLEESSDKEKSMKEALKREDVMTGLLQKLESNDDFRHVAESILTEAGEYLDVSNAFIMRKSTAEPGDMEDMTDIICEYRNPDAREMMTRFGRSELSEVPFFNGKSYTISSNSLMPDNFRTFFFTYSFTGGIFLPLFLHDTPQMYLCFTLSMTARMWTAEDIRFANDTRRILQSILSKRVTKNSLAGSYAAIDEILENTGCGIYVRDGRSGSVLYINETYHNMLNDAMDRELFERNLSDSIRKEEILPPGTTNRKSGHHGNREFYAENAGRWFSFSSSIIRWVDGRDVEMHTLYDITQLKKYQKRVQQQADLDDLTGLYNRHRFHNDLEKSIIDAARAKGQGTLLFLDLDDFNALNDGLGHVLGDQFLVQVADSLQQIAGGRAQCYRVGGDQFAILVPYSGENSVDKLTAVIQRRFEKPWRLDNNEYYCTACIGAARFPHDGDEEDVLTQRADYALHDAKKKGKNQITYYSEENRAPVARLDLEKAMREAVADGCSEFEVFYQPVIDINKPGHPCCGAEALVRWNSKKFGFMMPDSFIPLAEYLGLIIPIGEHVLIEAAKRCKYWNDFGHPEYKVNVNLSVQQLIQNNIVNVIKNAIDISGIIPSHLTLEVTESLAVNDMTRMKDVLNSIRALGCRLALDDFGTGYSSLNHLKEMPLDVIKIDKCFVNDLGKDDFSDAFIKTVSELADRIDVNVVVEGVEEQRQENTLEGMKINMIQGYLYDKPLPVDEFEAKYLEQ